MSHFAVYVFSKDKDIEELLAPYDENIKYPPYIKYTREQAIAKVRKDIDDYYNSTYKEFIADPEGYKEKFGSNSDHIKYLEEEFPKKLNWTDEECYEEMKIWYEDIDEEGNLYSTYNPKSKWDWYSIGGRWNNILITKEGTETNEDYANQIDWNKTATPFAFVTPIGVWHEKGEMGWWAMVSNEKDKNDWETEFKKFLDTLDDDVTVTLIDCHI